MPRSRLLWPTVALQLGWPGPLFQGQWAQVAQLRTELQEACALYVPLSSSDHHTSLVFTRESLGSPVRSAQWWGSLIGGHAPSLEAAQLTLQRLGLQGALLLPASSCPGSRFETGG